MEAEEKTHIRNTSPCGSGQGRLTTRSGLEGIKQPSLGKEFSYRQMGSRPHATVGLPMLKGFDPTRWFCGICLSRAMCLVLLSLPLLPPRSLVQSSTFGPIPHVFNIQRLYSINIFMLQVNFFFIVVDAKVEIKLAQPRICLPFRPWPTMPPSDQVNFGYFSAKTKVWAILPQRPLVSSCIVWFYYLFRAVEVFEKCRWVGVKPQAVELSRL